MCLCMHASPLTVLLCYFLAAVFHQRVLDADLSNFVTEMRTTLTSTYTPWQLDTSGNRINAVQAPEYYLSKYSYPIMEDTIYGFNALTNAAREPTIRKAVRTGNLAVSRRTVAVRNPEQASLACYCPVYNQPSTPTTEAARESASVGVVLAFVGVSEILSNIVFQQGSGLHIYVYDTAGTVGWFHVFLFRCFWGSPLGIIFMRLLRM